MKKIISTIAMAAIAVSLVGCEIATTRKGETSSSTNMITTTMSEASNASTTNKANTTMGPSTNVPTTLVPTTIKAGSGFVYRTDRTTVVKNLTVESFDNCIRSLRQSEFTNSYTCSEEDMGLSDMSNVGVDENRFYNEELVELPADATIYNVEDYNVTPDGKYNSGNLNKLLDSLKGVDGNKIVKFQGSTYKFQSVITINQLENLYFVGEDGCEFLNTSWGTYLEVKNSKNIFIKNIDFDMEYSPTISGKIVEVNETGENPVITIEVPQEFDLTNTLYTDRIKYYSSYMECVYDSLTGGYVPDRNGNLFYNTSTSSKYFGIGDLSYDASTRRLSIPLLKTFPWDTYKTPKKGTVVSFAYTMYDNHGFFFYNNENVTVEDVNCYVTGGMGCRIENGSNYNLNRFNFKVKEGSSRIMTATADTIHGMAVEGELNITNCLFEGSHDDALNIKSFYGKISAVSAAERELTITQTQSETVIRFEEGDTIDVYNPETMGLEATYKIVSSKKQGSQYVVTVDKRPSTKIVGMNAGNDTRSTSLSLDNCIIRNKRNRGILLQCRNSEIINCTFENVVMGAIQILSVSDSFAEAIVPRNVNVMNCKFLNNYVDVSVFCYGSLGSGSTIPSTITKIKINNNYFYNGNGTPIGLLGCGNAEIKNNLIDYSKAYVSKLITITRSDTVLIDGNRAYCIMDYTFISADANSTNITKKNNNDIQ